MARKQNHNLDTLKARLANMCRDLGLDGGPCWQNLGEGKGGVVAVVGAVFLERPAANCYRVCQMTNTSGGERDLSGVCTAAELMAWIQGATFAHRVHDQGFAKAA